MYILAIETTGPLGSVALVSEKGVLREKTSTEEMNHLKDLIPMIDELLRETGIAKKQLTHIAASVGPGSFTGIRIGVSTARALGQALGLPLIAVPTLETFKYKEAAAKHKEAADKYEEAASEYEEAAEDAVERGGSAYLGQPGSEGVICGILNARRGQVYGIVEGFMAGGPYMLTDVLEIIATKVKETGRSVMFFGDGIDAYREQILEILGQADMALDRDFFFAPRENRYQNAGAAGMLAMDKAKAGQVLGYEELHPDYMRKAEAEQKLEAGQLPICKLPKQE